jgi:hypothetical protein
VTPSAGRYRLDAEGNYRRLDDLLAAMPSDKGTDKENEH